MVTTCDAGSMGQLCECHDTLMFETDLEWTTQRRNPAGVWENVGTTGDYQHATNEYRDWVRDLGSPDDLRIVSRLQFRWPTADLLTPADF